MPSPWESTHLCPLLLQQLSAPVSPTPCYVLSSRCAEHTTGTASSSSLCLEGQVTPPGTGHTTSLIYRRGN
jgi:hypothetical protein